MTSRRSLRRMLALITAIPLCIGTALVSTSAPPAAASPAAAQSPTPGATGGGYWLLAADGGVFSFGSAQFFGAAQNRGADITGMAALPSGDGYWVADNDGDVFPAGAAADFGSRAATTDDVAAFGARPQGDGYWMATRTGAVEAFGAAPAAGGVTVKRSHRIVGLAPTPSGAGYWLGAIDGGVFSLGDAGFYGSMGGTRLNQPITGMAATPSGRGYWLVASDGGIFAFGDAGFYGSTGATKLNKPITGMAATPSGRGYWLVASDGGIFAFGDAGFYGSMGATKLNKPIVAMAAVPGTASGGGNGGTAGPGLLGAVTGLVPTLPGTLTPPVPDPGGLPVPPVLPGPAGPPEPGGIRYVNSTSLTTPKGVSSVTMPVPAGTRAGDVLVAMLQSDYGIVDHTPPPGWTLLTYREESLTDLTGYVFYKVAGPQEPASYTWQGGVLSDKTFIGGTMFAFRGVDTTNPIFDSKINNETSDTSKMQCPSANAPAGGMLLCLYTHDDQVTFINPPPSMTRVSYFTLPAGGKDDAHAAAYELIPAAGPTGTRVANIGSVAGGQNDLEIAVVLRPAP